MILLFFNFLSISDFLCRFPSWEKYCNYPLTTTQGDRFASCDNIVSKLERIQERALRALYCDNKSTYEELLHRAKQPTLHTRRPQAIAVLMYKVKNGLAPPYIADLVVVTNSQYHLSNHDFVIPRFRTVAFGKHSLTYLGPVIWSKLDISIRSSESLDTFKKRIKLVNFSSLLDSTCEDFFLCNN